MFMKSNCQPSLILKNTKPIWDCVSCIIYDNLTFYLKNEMFYSNMVK